MATRAQRSSVIAGVRAIAAGALLALPAVLAFADGGYFATARLWAAIAACVLAGVAAVAAPSPLPRSWAGRAAIAGLAGLLAWTIASRSWAPIVANANADAQRLALYLAVLVAAATLLRARAARATVPALAAGIVAVVAYGLSERLLPGLVDLAGSRAALGRLDQPVGYWNAMGAIAAMGLVLVAALAAGSDRPLVLRMVAASAAAPLGAGLALSLSRGAIAAAIVGLATLVLLGSPSAHLRAALGVGVLAGAGGALALLLGAVRTMEGTDGARQAQGAILLAGLVALAGAGAAFARWIAARPPARRPRRVHGLALALVAAAALALVIGTAALETGDPRAGADVARLSTADSNRYAYWRVALDGFAEAPLRGHGSGAFGVLWLEHRTVSETVRDAHSLPLETLAELGIAGGLLLAATVGGVVVCAASAMRRGGAVAAGPAAALVTWAAHCALDWDWEMPAVTLVAVLLAGLLVALADPPAPARA